MEIEVFESRVPPILGVRQGDIVTGIQVARSISADDVAIYEIKYAVVVSQACDLDWDYKMRSSKDFDTDLGKYSNEERLKETPEILLLEAKPVDDVHEIEKSTISQKFRNLPQNYIPRFHFVEAVTSELDSQGSGLPELVIDFKRAFSVGTMGLYGQLHDKSSSCEIRCQLTSLYREDLQHRFVSYLGRVGLPRQQDSTK